ncbi:hypothetical protein [Nocardioides sp. NPDC006273]|uniref:hypothetical protein n=1 Tax=Nocardioides sp. NPDC006273 TaxID=3155598 RepID=UPI0033A12715
MNLARFLRRQAIHRPDAQSCSGDDFDPSSLTRVVYGAAPMTPTRIREIGEIVVRGSDVVPGYREAPELTAESFRDGWFLTGAVAR